MVHVFSLCSPKDLANAVRVNKAWKGWTEEDLVSLSLFNGQQEFNRVLSSSRYGSHCSKDCLEAQRQWRTRSPPKPGSNTLRNLNVRCAFILFFLKLIQLCCVHLAVIELSLEQISGLKEIIPFLKEEGTDSKILEFHQIWLESFPEMKPHLWAQKKRQFKLFVSSDFLQVSWYMGTLARILSNPFRSVVN